MEKTPSKLGFSIGGKLVTIVTVIILVSLGLITFLVSYMVSADLRVTAEDTNFDINKRMTGMAGMILDMIRSNALVQLDILGREGEFQEYFFDQHEEIAALAAVVPETGEITVRREKKSFFIKYNIESSFLDSFAGSHAESIKKAADLKGGDSLLFNASPLAGVPLIVLAAPWQGFTGADDSADDNAPAGDGATGGGSTRAGRKETALVFFSALSIAEIFGTGTRTGTNRTFMINDKGDVLLHPDVDMLNAGANIAGDAFVSEALQSSQMAMQKPNITEDGTRYFAAFSKMPHMGALVITQIEERTVFEGINTTTRRNLFLTGAVLFLAVLLIWFFSKTISGPVKLLAGAALRIKEGEFEIDLPVKSRDEIGFLTTSFTEMGRGLAERERLKDTFGRFTNAAIAEQAARGELSLGGEMKTVTVFFSDIRSFTAISEKLEPHEVMEFLNDYMTRMVDCVDRTGGVVDKFIGDAVMAVWGAPLSSGSPANDAFSCIKSALLMRSVLHEFNKDRGREGKPRIRIGCGINSGDVVAGQMGSHNRMEYTVIGDTVNLASRTEALNKPLGTDILITENTWKLIGDYLLTEEMPPVTVKGKEKPVRLFAVINIKARQGKPQHRPVQLAELRQVLGIGSVDVSKVNVNEEETKYKIQSD